MLLFCLKEQPTQITEWSISTTDHLSTWLALVFIIYRCCCWCWCRLLLLLFILSRWRHTHTKKKTAEFERYIMILMLWFSLFIFDCSVLFCSVRFCSVSEWVTPWPLAGYHWLSGTPANQPPPLRTWTLNLTCLMIYLLIKTSHQSDNKLPPLLVASADHWSSQIPCKTRLKCPPSLHTNLLDQPRCCFTGFSLSCLFLFLMLSGVLLADHHSVF